MSRLSYRDSIEIGIIVVHCSATPNGRLEAQWKGQPLIYDIATIDEWHRHRGFRRQPTAVERWRPRLGHVGYHSVIHLDGEIAAGRHESEIGAHAGTTLDTSWGRHAGLSVNRHSLSVCLIGRDKFTLPQWEALRQVVDAWCYRYPIELVIGHNRVSPKKCPGFDVQAWIDNDKEALPGHILKRCKHAA